MLLKEACYQGTIFLKMAACSSRLHVTKDACSSGCLLTMAACSSRCMCIVTMAASFYVSQNLFNSRMHFSINYIFPKATRFQEGMFLRPKWIQSCMFPMVASFPELHFPPRMHVCKAECSSFIECFSKLNAFSRKMYVP
jgi:hypothetical protein